MRPSPAGEAECEHVEAQMSRKRFRVPGSNGLSLETVTEAQPLLFHSSWHPSRVHSRATQSLWGR
jgi:hypothetical protein